MSKEEAVDQDQLRALCAEASELIKRHPGAVRRVSIGAGTYHVDVELEPLPAGTALVSNGAPGAEAAAAGPDGAAAPDTRHAVVALLVGTFYRSPEPGAAPFVEVGDVVEAGQDVAIIEAMKVMNRIQSDVAGRVVEILVEDGEMVEFEQRLIVIEPTGGSEG
jgi:acetyl-CoA carboxylase biotin carboxyl carrier protein